MATTGDCNLAIDSVRYAARPHRPAYVHARVWSNRVLPKWAFSPPASRAGIHGSKFGRFTRRG